MMHEARDRQKFVNDAQYLRDMQHKVDSEYQACLRRQEKKRDQFCRQEASFERPRPSSISISSSRQNLVEEDLGPEQRISITSKASVTKSESKLPAIDQTSVKQKQKVVTSSKKPEKNVGGTSKPSPRGRSKHPLYCVECSPFYTVFTLSPTQPSNSDLYCFLLPLAQTPLPHHHTDNVSLPPIKPPSHPMSFTPSPVPPSPSAFCCFPMSCCPTQAVVTPLECLPRFRTTNEIYLIW
uniref:RING-type E3 ubiquitin transferase n=1 Tax=Monodelphis domestica TaxID=13616 RepID=A0A5F8GEV5_MONDO